jgi:hypothetical protein
MLSDTSAEAEKVQIELLREAGFTGRFARMQFLTAAAINLSRGAIAEASPALSTEELNLKWLELCYGKELVAGLRASTESR